MYESTDHWSIVYHKAIQDDGTLLFPERLTQAFLDRARRTMGSYIFANQYQNEIIPEGEQKFKKGWIRYFNSIPDKCLTFCFIDPAISKADTADFTGVVIISADTEQNWYVRYANRTRMSPSAIIETCFRIHEQFNTAIIGIEDVAFQKAIVHFAFEEMKRRGKQIPIMGVKTSNDKSKETRILSLVPRFEWGNIFLAQGLHDLELELAQFPRGAHDDLIDALSSINSIVHYPSKDKPKNEPLHPQDPGYEKQYISNLYKRAKQEGEGE